MTKTEAIISSKDKQLIKVRILSEIESTREQIAELEELTQPIAADNAIGRISRMEAINNKSVNEHLLAMTRFKLNKLETSLNSIDKADYGICSSCKEPIPLGRLMMLPEAVRCVNCA